MPRPLHRAGVRPPGGGFEGRTESCLAVDYGDDQPRPRPGLGRRLRGTCAWAPGRAARPTSHRIRVLAAGSRTGGDSRVERLRVAPGAAPDLKGTARRLAGDEVSQGEGGEGSGKTPLNRYLPELSAIRGPRGPSRHYCPTKRAWERDTKLLQELLRSV